jgi:hypothetical protein
MEDYKKYSLEQIKNWVADSLISGGASPQEIYETIYSAVREEYYVYKHHTSRAYELLGLLHSKGIQYTEEELNAMCDKAASDNEKEKCREYNLREAEYYNKRAELDAKQDNVVKWQLPIQVDGLTGDCFVEFPDDLLERTGLKEGDTVNWIDRGDGSFELRKVTKPLEMDEC